MAFTAGGALRDRAVPSPPPTAGGTSRATASRSTTRCRRSAASPSARSSSRCSRSPRCGRSGCTSPATDREPAGAGRDRRADPDHRGPHGRRVRRHRCWRAWCGSTRPTPTRRPTSRRSPAAAAWPTTCSSNRTPTPASWRRCQAITARSARWAASAPSASPPTACRTTSSPRRSGTTCRHRAPTTTGTRRSSCRAPGINGSTVPLPYGLDPKRVPLAGTLRRTGLRNSRAS